jgi:hypothetical protein
VELLLEREDRQSLRQPDPEDPRPGLDRGTLERFTRGVDEDQAPFVEAWITGKAVLGLVDAGIPFDIDVVDPVHWIVG